MARKPNASATREVKVRLPANAYDSLGRLAKDHGYGSNPAEVARYLILREIDDLKRAGILRPQQAT